jgi:hypothetical protein
MEEMHKESITPNLIRENKLRTKFYINEFKRQLKNYILTSRFNNSTWIENINFRKNNSKIGCIYCSPIQISNTIPIDTILFILEMNNENNRIMGIGMVRNHPTTNPYCVYNTGNYHRFIYVGKYRIDRDEMNNEEENIMKVFDILCFTGNRHMKRGQGLTTFPIDILYRCSKVMDLVVFINNMFKNRLNNKK